MIEIQQPSIQSIDSNHSSGIKDSIETLDAITNFAYESGFHELGYNPVKTIKDELQGVHALIVNAANCLEAGMNKKAASLNCA